MITKNIQEITFPNNLGTANRVKFKEVLNPQTEYIIGYSADFEYIDGVDYRFVHRKFYNYSELFQSSLLTDTNVFAQKPSEAEAFEEFIIHSLIIPIEQ